MLVRGYLNDTRKSLTQLALPPPCRLTEIMKPDDPRENCLKIMEAKHAEMRDLVNGGTFHSFFRTELPNGENMISERYALAIKSDKDKENDTK